MKSEVSRRLRLIDSRSIRVDNKVLKELNKPDRLTWTANKLSRKLLESIK